MTTQTDVAQLYTAFFDRAPDAAGLAYWVGQLDSGAINLAQMAKNWVDEQPEGQTKYPNGTTDEAFISAIYSNVLGRSADTEGAQYWQTQLASGAVSRDVFIQAIISGAHANTSAQGQLDAKLLDNKAAVGIGFAAQGVNDTTLAAKIINTVTSSDDSLSSALSLIKLIPAGQLTSAQVTSIGSTLDKVAPLITAQPGEQGDLATYLSTVSAGVTSSTNLDTLLTKIGTVATAALTDTHALDNPATLGQNDVASATPGTGGGGGGGTGPTDPTGPVDPAPTLTATNDQGVLKIAGNSTADVRVDMTAHKVTSGDATVAIVGDATFTGVDATGYNGSVTAVGTVKEIVSNSPVYNNVDHLEVVDTSFAILTWAKYYLDGVVDKISVVGNAAGTLSVDGYNELVALTGDHAWSYDIRDSVSEINEAADTGALLNTSTIVVADTLANLQTDAGAQAIADHPGYIVRDTYAHISGATGADATFLAGASSSIVHDSVAGVQAALAASAIPGGSEYEVQDTATNLLAINTTDPTFLKGPSSVTVTGDDAGNLSLAQRDALGKVTDDDFWAYSITDTGENIVANAQGTHSDYLQHASEVTVSDSVTLAQVGKVAAIPTLDTSNWHFSIVDTVANTADYVANGINGLALTATASDAADLLDGAISEGAVTMSFAGLSSAATFSFDGTGFGSTEPVDMFNNFAGATDKIDLHAFGLTGQDTLSLDPAGNHTITDGHFALLKGVALVEGVYTASTGSDAGTLVIWDADTTTNAIKQVGVFVADANVDVSHLVTALPA
ncbi:DUF4214 domain-containing protein [Pseudomonas sp. UBA1879]|uniref:DUF4214 domain-containing protein n=1 Tax=Pseudomonas sp. UBA1879 TaxID=1947305 RepID=UPI0025E96885|nr:DUF4214 domain-containing protein [Pseudomonas sp. UBA1879]